MANVLDNTIVLYGSGASTTHWARNLPTMVVVVTNMGIQHGRYWRQGENRMANLFLSILHTMGIEQPGFRIEQER